MFDWFVLGLYAGFRKSEWCQDTYQLRLNNRVALNVDGTSKAFVASDFTICSSTESASTDGLRAHNLVKIKWHFQKNGENGQVISFAHDPNDAEFSPVHAAQRILNRAKALKVPDDMPLAVYAANPGQDSSSFSFIDHHSVELHLKRTAEAVYNFKSLTDLAKFTLHSLRVGACVLMHVNGADPLLIKARLRWRSDSFMAYLRNTPRLAQLHNILFNNPSVDTI